MNNSEVGVLFSIQPQHCENICSGKKTIEVRKTKPKINVPFKGFIYETTTLYTKQLQYSKVKINGIGRVIGEFICDNITEYCSYGKYTIPEVDLAKMCLTIEDVQKYGTGKDLYGYHISDLKIYDEPKSITEFCNINGESLSRAPQSWGYVSLQK